MKSFYVTHSNSKLSQAIVANETGITPLSIYAWLSTTQGRLTALIIEWVSETRQLNVLLSYWHAKDAFTGHPLRKFWKLTAFEINSCTYVQMAQYLPQLAAYCTSWATVAIYDHSYIPVCCWWMPIYRPNCTDCSIRVYQSLNLSGNKTNIWEGHAVLYTTIKNFA